MRKPHPAGPSIRPKDISPTCADADFTLVYKRSISGKALGIKRHAPCHRAHCKRCHTPEAKTQRMLERRGRFGDKGRVDAEIEATRKLNATGCTVHLHYNKPDSKEVAGCLKAMHRSHLQQDGVVFYTQDGGVDFLATPQSAQRICERLGVPVERDELKFDTVGQILDRGYKAIRGWGGHSRARIFGDKPSTDQSPSSEVSITEYACQALDTDDSLRKRGFILPGDEFKAKVAASMAKVAALRAARGSNIDDGAAGVVPLNKEDEEMLLQAQHTELLREIVSTNRKIAANTATLPEMKKDLAAIRKILADYDAGRITKDERDRRVNRWVN